MTELGLDGRSQDETAMTKDDRQRFEDKLSPSAHSLLEFIKTYESGGQVNLFQVNEDTRSVIQMLDSFRGCLYSALAKRLEEVVHTGGVSIISQRDAIRVIHNLWNANVSNLSSTEMPFLDSVLRRPSEALSELSDKANLSYAQTRRAQKRLVEADVLRIRGVLNAEALALQRVTIMMESPSIVLTGPYIPLNLMVDGYENLGFSFGVIPARRQSDFLHAVRSTRSSNARTIAFGLSPGKSLFSGLYFRKDGWKIDLLHFQLMLRNDSEQITIADVSKPSQLEPSDLRASDLQIMDSLLDKYNATAGEISKSARVSTATAFRRRAEILKRRLVLPRARIKIPVLSDRICCIASPQSAGNILEAWNCLPLTYSSIISNLEAPSEKKLLLMAALPAGSGRDVIRIIEEEVSRVAPFKAFLVSAGVTDKFRVEPLFDHKRSSWKWGPHFLDVRNYSTIRREASPIDIPFDLAI